MKNIYILIVLISSAWAKIVIQESTINATDKSPKEESGNDLDSDLGIDITEEKTNDIEIDNGTALILTPYLKDGRLAEARNASAVDPSVFLGIQSHSGYFTVDEKYNSNIFFWYFPIENKPVNETPWIVWLQGGPGASSMTGLFDELGPVSFTPYGTLRKNPHTWLQNHSLVFIDNPVGTGYSFTENKEGFVHDLDTYGRHLYSTIKQLVQLFPELGTAPLFVAGESYAGKYVPALAMEIHRHKNITGEPHINLQGLMAGNAFIDPEVVSHATDSFEYFGLLDHRQVELVQPLMEGFQDDLAHNRNVEAKIKWQMLIASLLFLTNQKHGYNFLKGDLPVGRYAPFLARPEVKRAIHVGDIKFSFLNLTVNTKLAPDFLRNTKPLFEELLDHYRVLVYCGHLDQMLPCYYSTRNYRTWKWNRSDQFLQSIRLPYDYYGRTAGYHKSGGGLTEVVFLGAGHMVPMDAAAPARALVATWTSGDPIPAPAHYYNLVSYYINNTLINM